MQALLALGLVFALLAAAIVWHVLLLRLAPRLGLVKPNFLKKPILASYGLVQFPYIAAIGGVMIIYGRRCWTMEGPQRFVLPLYLGVMAAMWALGAADDLWGSRDVGGFGGHFKKLIFERKVTTGAIKAIGGGITALAAGWVLHPDDVLMAILSAAVVALATNTINLLDLRPGRAVAVFFCGLGVTYILTCGRPIAFPLIPVIAAVALVFGIADARGKAMMGDSGSNSLGAAMGLTIALGGLVTMIPALICFVALHVYSEKRSISELIERNRLLRTIDRYLGVR